MLQHSPQKTYFINICDDRNDCQTWGGELFGSMMIKLGKAALAAKGEGSF